MDMSTEVCPMQYNDIHIKMFQAKSGDCFLIEFLNADFRVLIDGGYVCTYNGLLRPYLKKLNTAGKHINLMIISHIDQDHINGIKALLHENGDSQNPNIIQIDEVWFNGFNHTDIKREKKEIPYYEECVLQTMANQNVLPNKADGVNEISFSQGESVAELLIKNGYNWNSSVDGSAICIDKIQSIKLKNIEFQILNPTKTTLNNLAEEWIRSLKSKCESLIISDNHLFDDAFESAYINEHDDWEINVRKISNHDSIKKYDWETLAELPNERMDAKLSNCSSIAVLITYEGTKLLFPGDCAINLFKDKLPDKIDIVKLPHHGSGKNVEKEFIQNTCVKYYLISTDGKHTGHPSPMIVANILARSQNGTRIIKNYDISILDGVGELEGE